MKLLIKKFFRNLFRNILGQKENISRKEKGYEKQGLTPLKDIKDDEQIKNRRRNEEPVKPQAELDLHGKTTKDTCDHDKRTEDSRFFRDNFHKYKPDENKDVFYDEQIKNRRRNEEPVKPQAELDLHGKTTKDAYDHDKRTEDSRFFRDNFHKYKPDENKDGFYDEQIKNRRRNEEPVKPQAELDLHGKTSAEASMSLKSFIESSRRMGLEQVLIISGKGNHSKEGKAVLRPMVGKWLNGEGKTQISKYANAPPKYGGSGAILVWLK
jgi:DNA-nicking Smr family endonuclease